MIKLLFFSLTLVAILGNPPTPAGPIPVGTPHPAPAPTEHPTHRGDPILSQALRVLISALVLFGVPITIAIAIRCCCRGLRPRGGNPREKREVNLSVVNRQGEKEQYDFVRTYVPQPGSLKAFITIALALFEFLADIISFGTSLDAWIEDKQNIFAILSFTVVLYMALAGWVIYCLYEYYGNPKRRCWNPKNLKFWLLVWFYPNMCVVAPNAALLKVTYRYVSMIETILYVYRGAWPWTSNVAVWGKWCSLVIEAPIVVVQSVMITLGFIYLGKLGDTELEETEWHQIILQVEAKWGVGIPKLSDIFLAKRHINMNGSSSSHGNGKKSSQSNSNIYPGLKHQPTPSDFLNQQDVNLGSKGEGEREGENKEEQKRGSEKEKEERDAEVEQGEGVLVVEQGVLVVGEGGMENEKKEKEGTLEKT